MNTAGTFDEKAKDWDKHPIINEMSRLFAEEIGKHVKLSSDMTLLDFGCGTGAVSMYFYPLVRSIRMTDTSQGMLNVLRQKIEQNDIRNMELFCGDISDLKSENERFDLIYALMSLHHVRNINPLIETFHHLLKPDAHLCIGDLEPEDGTFHEGDFDGHQGFDTAVLKNTLEHHGFGVADIRRLYVVKKPDKQGILRQYPMFFMLAENRRT